MSQPDLFPNEPTTPAPPRDSGKLVLEYALTKPRGITLHGVMRNVLPNRNEAMEVMSTLKINGLLVTSGKRRHGCYIHVATGAARKMMGEP